MRERLSRSSRYRRGCTPNRAPLGKERNPEAEAVYRAVWSSWLLTRCPLKKQLLEAVMGEQTTRIATGPGDIRWIEFTESLPGFLEWVRRDMEGCR